MPSFDSDMREILISCSEFDWSLIFPRSVRFIFLIGHEPRTKKKFGGTLHCCIQYFKINKTVILDDLWKEFDRVKTNKNKLAQFYEKLSKLKFLDPACGCGNFLVVTYRELRLLEIEILKIQYKSRNLTLLAVGDYSKIDVNQMYGIEIEEFPAKIAEVAMWLMDHQMNIKLSEELGKYYVRLPLKNKAKIILGNSLKINWNDVIPKNELSYILGNPPFVGKQMRSSEQTNDHNLVMKGVKEAGVLDFVACWYIKATQYIQNTFIKVAFVSTNSI